jgi:hypothetical protein
MLVLLMGDIYEVRLGDGLMRHDIHTTFHPVQAFKQYYGYYLNNLRGSSVGITDVRDL